MNFYFIQYCLWIFDICLMSSLNYMNMFNIVLPLIKVQDYIEYVPKF